MSQVDENYKYILNKIICEGETISGRNGDTESLLGQRLVFYGTPLVSVRRTAWKLALREFEWFLSGSNDINDLHESVRHWWEPWANESGYIHNNYSKQFRDFAGHGHNGGARYCDSTDQVQYLIDQLKNDPHSRRNVITTWHTHDMVSPKTPITNCHGSMIQVRVNSSNEIDMIMYQRSADMILGVPHNWIQYHAFMLYLAHQSGRKVGSFTWLGGDCHIYEEHLDIAEEIIDTDTGDVTTPELIYTPTSNDFKADDFKVTGYKPILKKSPKMVV